MNSEFIQRHIGPSEKEQTQMLDDLGLSSLDELVRQIVPDSISVSYTHLTLPTILRV